MSTICRALYHDLGFPKKRITRYNREKSLLLQQDYWRMLRFLKVLPQQLVFIDETSKDARDIARLYGR